MRVSLTTIGFSSLRNPTSESVGSRVTEHRCPSCERSFATLRAVRVHHSRTHGTNLPNRRCANCETEFHAEHERKYCSGQCREASTSRSGRQNPNYKGAKTVGECELCGAAFEFYPSDKSGRYCPDCVDSRTWQKPPVATEADNPRWKGGKRDVDCVVCGTTVERYPSNIGTVTVCGEKCRREWLSETFSGSGHPNWKGGGNGSYGAGWNAVRKLALKRDGYECLVCGATSAEIGRNPDVHHIVPVRWFVESENHSREDAHFLDNVVSLCVRCHRKADFGNISREELRSLIEVADSDSST